jgi:hypothetical protein
MRLLFAAAAVLGLVAVAVESHASPITYTESAVASGSLGGRSFTNALVTITGSADTSDVQPSYTGYAVITPGAQVTVAGVGTYAFTDTIQFFVGPEYDVAGVTDLEGMLGLDILDTMSSAFETYNLTTAFGPASGSPILDAGDGFGTSAGALILNSAGNSTFTATTGQ